MDVCRQCIVFKCIADLVKCLLAIETDPEVSLVRIKNRMDPKIDSALSGGYRDVAINLRIVSPYTVDLCLDTHVCEIQLILRAIVDVKVRNACTVCDPKCS